MDKPKKNEKVGIRITEELRIKIQEEAMSQNRTESNMITTILEEYFDSKERFKKIAEKK